MNTTPLHALSGFRRLALTLALFALALTACSSDEVARQFAPLPEDATVLVLGDSLVAGTGASRQAAWPQQLADSTGWNVVNAGIPGDTTADALARLDGLLFEYRPDAVILAIGGNDFLRDHALERTRDNIETMIRESLAVTQHVALVSIPAKPVGAAVVRRLSDHELYAELADDYGLAIIPSAVSEVLSSAELRSDRIHANARGYEYIAQQVEEALGRQGWRIR